MSGGGSGGSGTQQYNWNDTLAPQWANAISWARGLTDPTGVGAYHQYSGPDSSVYGGARAADGSNLFSASSNDPTHRIANLTQDQLNAMQNIRLYGTDPTYGVQDPNTAQNAGITQELQTLSGAYLNADPYAGTQNPFMGESPEFQNVLNSGLQDITNAYNQGTSAETTRLMNLSGVLGGSAHQNAVANNQAALAKQLGTYTSGMQNDQFNRSAQLAESGLNRGSQAFQNERNRQISALAPTQNEQNLALQRENAVLGVGDSLRGYNQDLLNQAYTDSQSQQNQQFRMLDYLSGLLGRAQGGVSPNMTYTTPGYQASPFSQVIGAGLLGYGLTH